MKKTHRVPVDVDRSSSRRWVSGIFYVISILILVVFTCFLFAQFKYDNYKVNPKAELLYSSGVIKNCYDVRGTVYIEFENVPDVEFSVDQGAIVDEQQFNRFVEEKKEFNVGYSCNTKHSDQFEIITLESENSVFVSKQSREKSVTISFIVMLVGAVFFSTFSVVVIIKFIKFLGRGSEKNETH